MTQPRSAATTARNIISMGVNDGLIVSRQRIDMRQESTIEPVVAELAGLGHGRKPVLPADDGVHYFFFLIYPDGGREATIIPEPAVRTALYVHALAVKPDVARKYASPGMYPFAED